jgi:outer membrane protein assembly factor BamB
MLQRHITCAVLVACGVAMNAGAAESFQDFGQVAGYRRDGSGVCPGVKPPVQFDFAKDLRWEAQIPCWGEGSPIIVGPSTTSTGSGQACSGQAKVILMSEPAPGKYWPELLCYALADGKLLWSKELDSAEAMFPADEAKRKDAADKWQKWVDATRQGILLRWQYLEAKDESAKTALLDQAAKLGFRSDKGSGGVHLRDHDLMKPAEELGLSFGGWYPNYPAVIGVAYPTPVSDGKHIYVTTWHGLVACFDLDGNRQWLSYRRVDLPKIHTCGCSGARSPIIYKNLLISDLGEVVCAFDRTTGKQRWSDTTDCDVIVSPAILTVPTDGGGTADVLWAAGAQVYLLPDGKRLTLEGWNPANHGMLTLVKHDEPDVVFLSGQGEHCGWTNKGDCDQPPPAALRCRLEGEKLIATVLWNGLGGKKYRGGGGHPSMCYYAGKLFFPGRKGLVFDAVTGAVLFGDPAVDKNACVADTGHLLLVANGLLYGLNDCNKTKGSDPDLTPGAILQVSTPEGKIVATSTIPELPMSTDDRAIIDHTSSQWKTGRKGWGTFAYSGSDTFTFGPDCIVIRGNARLYCIGNK